MSSAVGPLSSQETVTGNTVAEKISGAAGRPVAYVHFPDGLLKSDRFLGKLAELVDEGRLAGHAVVAAFRRQFRLMLTMGEWLVGPGKAALSASLRARGELALR